MPVFAGVPVIFSGIFMLWVGGTVGKAVRAHALKELWPWNFRIRCELDCPYGYQTDVEGNYVCVCYNPCENVLCFANTKCTVELPKACRAHDCRPLATCTDVGFSGNPQPSSTHAQPMGDDATTTSLDTSVPDRCFLPVKDEAKQCRKAHARWYYDDVSGTCRPFLGCRTKGNNFRGRRGCEKTCLVLRAVKKNDALILPTQSDAKEATAQEETTSSLTVTHAHTESLPICTLSVVPVTSGCTKLRRRWYFDKDSGKCRKFRGCVTPGNNFSKKKYCKSKCLNSATRRREKRFLAWLAKQ